MSTTLADQSLAAVADAAVCECCGCDRHSLLTSKRKHALHRCDDCGVMFVHPVPSMSELAALYSKAAGYFATAQTELGSVPPASAMWLDSALIAHGVHRGRILDVGCANGSLIHAMRGLGWEVSGVDLNADAVAIAQKHGLDAVAGTLETVRFDSGRFDVVYLGDVIEHVPSPRAMVREAHRILRLGGLIAMRTPNARSGYALMTLMMSRLTGLPWAHAEAPYHLHEFSLQSLNRLLESNGFSRAWGHAEGRRRFMYQLGAIGWFDSLKRRMKQRGGYRAGLEVIPHAPALALTTAILGPLALAGRLLDRMSLGGSDLFVGARKA